MATKRLNITIEEAAYELIKAKADELYGGNVSRYLTDSGIFYAGVLRERKQTDERLEKAGKI